LLETVEALAVSSVTGCDAVVDSPLVEGDCAADCSAGELVSGTDAVKLVWLAVAPALASSIPPSGALVDGARARVPPCLFAAGPLSGIGLGSTVGPPSVCDVAALPVSNATAGAVVPSGLCNHPTS
jgi:hypothetical protein